MAQISTDRSIDTLVRTHADMVYRLAMLHMKQRSDAEDIFQEVFLRLVKHVDSLKSEEHIKAWLIRVTINCCKTQLSGSWKKKVVAVEHNILEQTIESNIEPENDEGTIRDVVETLPEKYRDVIHLFYFEDLSISQIAGVLSIREGTVKAQLSRGRNMIRKIMEGGTADE